jgi:hypothetical protein
MSDLTEREREILVQVVERMATAQGLTLQAMRFERRAGRDAILRTVRTEVLMIQDALARLE